MHAMKAIIQYINHTHEWRDIPNVYEFENHAFYRLMYYPVDDFPHNIFLVDDDCLYHVITKNEWNWEADIWLKIWNKW